MNAKKAKKLRAESRLKTVGLPYRVYVRVDQLGRRKGLTGIELGQCTRAAYKFLKQGSPAQMNQ